MKQGLRTLAAVMALLFLALAASKAQTVPPPQTLLPGGNFEGIAAIVNSTPITYSDLKKAMDDIDVQRRALRKVSASEPRSLREMTIASEGSSDAALQLKELRNIALTTLIVEELIIEDFKATGATIPESVIEEYIERKTKELVEGNRDDFIRILAYEGMTLEDYRNDTRRKMIINSMRNTKINSITKYNPSTIPSKEEEQKILQARQKAQLSWTEELKARHYIKTF